MSNAINFIDRTFTTSLHPLSFLVRVPHISHSHTVTPCTVRFDLMFGIHVETASGATTTTNALCLSLPRWAVTSSYISFSGSMSVCSAFAPLSNSIFNFFFFLNRNKRGHAHRKHHDVWLNPQIASAPSWEISNIFDFDKYKKKIYVFFSVAPASTHLAEDWFMQKSNIRCWLRGETLNESSRNERNGQMEFLALSFGFVSSSSFESDRKNFTV